jgi:hypothetical protein
MSSNIFKFVEFFSQMPYIIDKGVKEEKHGEVISEYQGKKESIKNDPTGTGREDRIY